ncbi:uncharacterized protein LOC110046008 [Orbicella faveolata]|uniref:uncharacterized protein LOC110046008 n=1 Tax=Orbicella faveolata TaxID=48498 RepID=UPI0009E44E46|nr:uncharacterized protein LOC110046008 [Orbicella faveolata]
MYSVSILAIPDHEVLPQTTTVPIPARVYLSHEELSATPDEILPSTRNLPFLPDCVTYEGFHEYGFHLIRVDSEKYSGSVESSDSIPDYISSIIGGDKCVVVFKQLHGDTTYLPDQSAYGRDLFHHLSAR